MSLRGGRPNHAPMIQGRKIFRPYHTGTSQTIGSIIHGIIVITDNAAGRGVSHTPQDNTPNDNTRASNKVNKGVCDTPLHGDAIDDNINDVFNNHFDNPLQSLQGCSRGLAITPSCATLARGY
ncbi:MAG: hypothetical protein LBF59_01995 [Prevotellaceae bacterium]|nr:hypothetical protein [Prevotellaceae bacterium]